MGAQNGIVSPEDQTNKKKTDYERFHDSQSHTPPYPHLGKPESAANAGGAPSSPQREPVRVADLPGSRREGGAGDRGSKRSPKRGAPERARIRLADAKIGRATPGQSRAAPSAFRACGLERLRRDGQLPFGAPRVITPAHLTASFDCGKAPLNEFLQRYALTNSQSGNSRTFVVADAEEQVVGYYSLAAADLEHEVAPPRVRQGQPRYPIPAILMARFAVDRSQQGKGLGRALLRDALLRSLHITEDLGARAFVVDAKDEEAARFYAQFGLMEAPADVLAPEVGAELTLEELASPQARRLYLLFKDVKKILAG